MAAKQTICLIAENFFDKPKYTMLDVLIPRQRSSTTLTSKQQEQILARCDLAKFIGAGCEINLCHRIASPAAAGAGYDLVVIEDVGGAPQFFVATDILEVFPLIEGTLTPGIYDWGQGIFYEVTDPFAWSKLLSPFANMPTPSLNEFKIVSHADGIDLIGLPDGELMETITRYPFDFFDVFCPMCHQKVVTHKVSQDEYDPYHCQVVETRCEHFVGNSIWRGDGYDPGDLETHGMNYRLTNGDVYFEVAPGVWQKAIRHNVPHTSASNHWGDPPDGKYRDDFFFVREGLPGRTANG